MELFVHKINGKKTSKKIKLDNSVFGVEPNTHAIYLDVKSYLANKRQGTHKTKQRADIKGSTRKIKSRKEQGQQEPAASKIQYSEEVEGFLVQPQETILRK